MSNLIEKTIMMDTTNPPHSESFSIEARHCRFTVGFGSPARGQLFLKRFRELVKDEVLQPFIGITASEIVINNKNKPFNLLNRMYWWDTNYEGTTEARNSKSMTLRIIDSEF